MTNSRRCSIQVEEPSLSYVVDTAIDPYIDLDQALDQFIETMQLLGNPKITNAMFLHWTEPPPHTQDGYEITDLDEHERKQ